MCDWFLYENFYVASHCVQTLNAIRCSLNERWAGCFASIQPDLRYKEIDTKKRECCDARPAVACLMTEERQLNALRLLEENPEMSQRELAEALGVSVGAANYCLKALVEKGWVKLENFQKNPNKLGYLYLLTPMGIAAKAHLTASFLRRKMAEYEALRAEIDQLQAEADGLVK